MVNIITGGTLSLPIIQFLKYNKVKVSVFVNAVAKQDSLAELTGFCNYASIPLTQDAPDHLYDWFKSTGAKVTFIIGYSHLVDISRISKQQLLYCYNIHFGPLPSYRGANPVFWQIKNGCTELAVTIHRINDKFDDGPVFWKKKIKREPHFSFGTVNNILSNISIEGVAYILQNISAQKIIPAIEPEVNAIKKYYPKPKLENVLIDWNTMNTNEIIDLILACNPWNKGAITIQNGREVKILDAFEADNGTFEQKAPGTILNITDILEVQCINKKVLCITMLNIDGDFIPARHAAFFGLNKDMSFTSGFTKQ